VTIKGIFIEGEIMVENLHRKCVGNSSSRKSNNQAANDQLPSGMNSAFFDSSILLKGEGKIEQTFDLLKGIDASTTKLKYAKNKV